MKTDLWHATAFLVLSLVSSAQAEKSDGASTTLDGWRGYKFGMTMAQARHITKDFDKPQPLRTKEYGRDALVSLRFLPVSGLRQISLEFSGNYPTLWTNISPVECEAKYRDILAKSEARYGAFGSRTSGSKVGTVSIRTLQGHQSRYSETVGATHPGWGFRIEDAVRYHGPRFVVVQMVNMEFGTCSSTCQLSLGLVDPT